MINLLKHIQRNFNKIRAKYVLLSDTYNENFIEQKDRKIVYAYVEENCTSIATEIPK